MSAAVKVLTQQERVQQEAIEALERLGGKTFKRENYKHEGTVLVIPANQTLGEAWRWIKGLEAEEAEQAGYSRQFKYKPWDVAYNAFNALVEHFGSAMVGGTRSFWGSSPPQMIDVPISSTETVQVPWGTFTTPYLPDVEFSFDSVVDSEYGLIGVVFAHGPKNRAEAIQGVFQLIEAELAKNSIYRGKAFTAEQMPRFVDVQIDPDKVVYSAETRANLEANIFSMIRYRGLLEKLDQRGKRASLLCGDFGTGKSLAVGLTAQEAVKNGWTAIIVRPGRDSITDAFRTARMYGPAVICVEDVDTIADAGQEVSEISHILELFDGLEAKNQKIMVVLTTNHPEKLYEGMLRPGRLDAVIPIGLPDAEGIRKLIEVNVPSELLDEGISWEPVAGACEGFLPAFVVEAATRALRYAVVREGKELGFDTTADGETLTAAQETELLAAIKLTTEDLVFSALSLKEHLAMMKGASGHIERPRLDAALASIIDERVDERFVAQILN